MQVSWVPLQKKGEFGVLSACSGGRVLLWTVGFEQGSFVQKAAYAVLQQQVPHSSSRFKVSFRLNSSSAEKQHFEIPECYGGVEVQHNGKGRHSIFCF